MKAEISTLRGLFEAIDKQTARQFNYLDELIAKVDRFPLVKKKNLCRHSRNA